METTTEPQDKSDTILTALGPKEIKLEQELFRLYNIVDNSDQVPQCVLRQIDELERILGY